MSRTDQKVYKPKPLPENSWWRKAFTRMLSLPYAYYVLAAWYAMKDKRTPWAAKMTLGGALIYFVSPLDAIPDFVPGIGMMDDAALVMAALAAVRSSILPEHIVAAKLKIEELLGGTPTIIYAEAY